MSKLSGPWPVLYSLGTKNVFSFLKDNIQRLCDGWVITMAVKTCITGQIGPLILNKMLEVIFLVPGT